ncbi:tumor necrosis factor receptor superfamily member 14-like isoform X1 [Pygocentrus nattereri]|uniref:tumor necrosis factor receptor superfamily member 14-like isoform X1 n=1 Tax=Pygocentrus nattereri TaxID=42514 RepID=UPI0018910216|nr:tumor necrosis factor receptor superfamily member 14-like isoform X1 [Pygocentrus nattereri]
MKSVFLVVSLSICGLQIILSYGCGPSEYRSRAGECCPMCSIGIYGLYHIIGSRKVVYRECDGDSSTTCIPCHSGTFMNQPNGFFKCFQCKICDKEQGLYNLHTCTQERNTVCGVLDGYYCKDRDENKGCTFPLKHRQCEPGEGIKVPGTKDGDTECEECPHGFYSPLGINCTKWTDCSVKDQVKDTEGSSVKDVQCKVKTRQRHGLIAAAAAVFLALCTAVLYCVNNKRSAVNNIANNTGGNNTTLKSPIEETAPGSLNSPEENREEDFT